MSRFRIRHRLDYHYNRAALLTPQLIRLLPRHDAFQQVTDWRLRISPDPAQQQELVGLDGNRLVSCRFDIPVEGWSLVAEGEVETTLTNPFDFLVEDWANRLPIDYPLSLRQALHPYLQGTLPNGAFEPETVRLAQELCHTHHGYPVSFVMGLCEQLNRTIRYEGRESGDPFLPGWTLKRKAGSCRDIAVVFLDACRAMGLAARFVSGYHCGTDNADRYDLHAWVEVYFPGAGWRGLDPTLGLAVGDRHIALATAATPLLAAPISGRVLGAGLTTRLDFHIGIETLELQQR